MTDFTKSYDNEWSNLVMMIASKNPGLSHDDCIEAAKAEYVKDGLSTPWDEGWKGTKRT